MGNFGISKGLLFLVLLSCNELEDKPMNWELDYQPLEIGNFWEYEVEETIFFGEADAETSRFRYKDLITAVYINEAGERVFVLSRTKSFDHQNWMPEKTYTYKISKGVLIKNMDNHLLISFVFPPREGMVWDGNAYNSLPEDDFSMVYHPHYHDGGINYEHAVKVVQNEEDDLITVRDNRFEVFVKNIGMVESYYEVLTYCSRNDCLGKQLVDGGRRTHLRLINYG